MCLARLLLLSSSAATVCVLCSLIILRGAYVGVVVKSGGANISVANNYEILWRCDITLLCCALNSLEPSMTFSLQSFFFVHDLA